MKHTKENKKKPKKTLNLGFFLFSLVFFCFSTTAKRYS